MRVCVFIPFIGIWKNWNIGRFAFSDMSNFWSITSSSPKPFMVYAKGGIKQKEAPSCV